MFTKMELNIPAGVEITLERAKIIVKGPKGQAVREFPKDVEIKKVGTKLEVSTKGKTAAARALLGTFIAHIKNMLAGVQNPYVYKLKIASIHFPITVVIENKMLTVKNFLGEKRARRAKIPENVTVKVQGDFITVESADIEIAGMTATRIEQATRISGRDRRTFLDGIYLVEKAGIPVTAD